MYFDRELPRTISLRSVVIWITLCCVALGMIRSREVLPSTQPVSLANAWGWCLIVVLTLWLGAKVGYTASGNAEGSIIGLAIVVTLWVVSPLVLAFSA